MKTCVVIPAYNAKKHIAEVITRCLPQVDTIIVVDDGSSDCTGIIALNSKANIVHRQWPNQGIGAALRMGFRIALSEAVNADIIVSLDADGQHAPEEIPALIAPILQGKADMVIGTRFDTKSEVPIYRKFGIDMINLSFNIFNSRPLRDTQSGFRAYKKEVLQKLTIEEDRFSYSTEVLVKIRHMGLKIGEVPIKCIYHKELAENSTSNPVSHGMAVLLKTLYWRLKVEYPFN
jgi:glycosyltransferase involved in cell wall biosynthesis